MNVLITGAKGFIGKNLQSHLIERQAIQVRSFTRGDDVAQLPALLKNVDFVFHLAGVNRPLNPLDSAEFALGNTGLTQALCMAVGAVADATGRKIPIVFTSSTQALLDNAYGASKLAAEEALFALQREQGVPVSVIRLPNVFGKWCRPHYNSGVASFCHNIARGLPITVHDPSAPITLVYVDDVVARFLQLMESALGVDVAGVDAAVDAQGFATVSPQYTQTVGELVRLIQSFKDSRHTQMLDRVGTGLVRALYATYVSHLPPELFAYTLAQHADPRGVFVEVLKTPDCGQFSYFTALPGITRGGHYHHTKTEKFLVVKGQARFRFKHMQTGQSHEILTRGDLATVVETVPGWTHDITNVGTDEMIVMLWANEVFDRARPDTFACAV